MLKDKGTSMKISKEFKSFIDNIRATRRSKIMGVDEDFLSFLETCNLIIRYFKFNNLSFQELIKLKMDKNV